MPFRCPGQAIHPRYLAIGESMADRTSVIVDFLAPRLTGPTGRRLVRGYQGRLLRRLVQHACQNSLFYRSKVAEAGSDPSTIRSAADLPRLGFFTLPTDLQADPFRFLAVPREQLFYVMSSSGTTGEPKIVFFTRQDWEINTRIVSSGFRLLGVRPSDVAQILFAYGNPSWPTGDVVQRGLEQLGVFVVPMGNAAPVAKQIATMRRFGTTMLIGTPSYIHRLTEEGAALCDLRSLGIRLIRLGAEPWSEALRCRLAEAWGAEVYDAYGMVELAVAGAGECPAFNGLHLSPYVLVEVVDPKTGQPVPRGELGELVFTTLLRQATPLLRYRSGDLGRLLPDERCSCGVLPTERIDRIAGRVDDMLFLGTGENIFPAQLEAALTGVPGLIGFQVIVEKDTYRDRLRVRVEAAAPSAELAEAIRQALYAGVSFLYHDIVHTQTIEPVQVEFLTPGSLQRESPIKIRTVVDRR
jgi:phenylacetate-CoA ligase